MSPLLRSTARRLLVVVGLALAYFFAARLLISLSPTPSGPVTTVWLPSGIAVAALVLYGPWAAIGSFAASLAVALNMGSPLQLAVAVSLGNGCGELLCYWLVAASRKGDFSVDGVSDGPRLAAGALACGVVSATASVSMYVQYGFVPAQAYVANWLVWMGSGVSSIVLVSPLLVQLVRSRGRLLPWSRLPEYAAALCVLIAGAFLWQGPVLERGVNEPVLLLLILGQIWIAFRFSPAAVTLSNCVIAVFAVAGLVARLGEAQPASAYPFILSLQVLLTGLALIGLGLAAIVARLRASALALQEAQHALVASARDAGRAEIATNVLHNVGNVLNSVNVSAQVVVARLQNSKVQGLARAMQMMDAHRDDLPAFLTQDAKGRLLPAYLDQATKALASERDELVGELRLLERNVDHIKDVVKTQQSYAGVTTVLAPVQLREVVEDALRLAAGALEQAEVTVVREFDDVPVAALDKARIVQILVNLIRNAKHAMAHTPGARRLTLRIGCRDDKLFVTVADEGEGIPAENLTRIFAHGFTTRKDGHGFGLHGAVLAATEMGGTLTAHSDGPGRGATFTLQLPADVAVAA